MTTFCDTLLKAEWIITQDAMRTVIENGAIAVSGGRILEVGPESTIAGRYSPAQTLELGESLIMPGLINAHTHAAMTIQRGVSDDLPLMEWLTTKVFPIEQHLTPDIVETGALLACAEMARLGTTAFNDMYLIQDATFRAVDKAGLRVLGGEGIFEFPSPAYANPDDAFALIRASFATWKNHPRVKLAIMPHAVYTSNPELLTRCKELAEELELPLNIHLGETRTETEQCLEKFGKRPVPYAHDLGLLGPRTTVAHAVDLTDDEISILAETGTIVAHNPESNMKLSSGVARIPDMLDKGVTVSLGTDGAASNNALNMFTEMTSCALLHKLNCMDPTCAPAQSVLDMATLGGAQSLCEPETGSLVAGNKADIIALDLTAPNMQPMHNPVSHAVYAATGAENRLTMVDGNIIYLDGEYKTIDYPALRQEMRNIRKWVNEKIS